MHIEIHFRALIIFVSVFTLNACTSEESPSSSSGLQKVAYHTVDSLNAKENKMLGDISGITHLRGGGIYVYDSDHKQILELSPNGEIRNAFAREGRGAGGAVARVIKFVTTMLLQNKYYLLSIYLLYF